MTIDTDRRATSGGSGGSKWGPYYLNAVAVHPSSSSEMGFASRLSWVAFPNAAMKLGVKGTGGAKTIALRVTISANALSAGTGVQRVALMVNGVDVLFVDITDAMGTGVFSATASLTIADDDLISIRSELTAGTGNVTGGGIVVEEV